MHLVNRFTLAEILKANKGEGVYRNDCGNADHPPALQGVTPVQRICHKVSFYWALFDILAMLLITSLCVKLKMYRGSFFITFVT